jgi:hypothetical protein
MNTPVPRREVEVGFEAGVKGEADAGAVIAHAIQPIEVHVGIVTTELILPALAEVDEHLELVEVALKVSGQEEMEGVADDHAVADVEFTPVGEVNLAQIGVAKLGHDVLDCQRGAVLGVD